MTPFRQAFQSYFAGDLTIWDIALDMEGTPFQLAVWQALAAIPYGSVTTYGALAQSLGQPRAVRAVAAAVGKNPLPVVLPCHRVVGADQTLTGYRGGLMLKEQLLALEGVRGLSKRGHERFNF
ncbi:methylated-DNA--[protein]-cysteine S-methyltransferase [Sulfobacillus sp. DSM 109850]|uniref:methylated-DNA--[protein]-cysteine S-methyltransferase n=2 Tax=Sulfobacillus harzensis TaxID=2729629 RepID=A0A7Y0L4G8_9FIRM|nr:methylated-DNA--[protein]-cysteine S-methyltransferase [Sulfobacillus harzensis]